MKTKTKIAIIKVLCLISLLITTLSIRSTYAKYYEKMNTTYATTMKKWMIQVNEKDILEEELTAIMEPTFESDENITDNVLVPGRIGYFDLNIDYTYVDVSFTMDVKIEQPNATKLTDFELYGYSEDEGTTIVETTDFSQSIDVTAETKEKPMRIYFRWNDNEGNNMDDEADTKFKGTTKTGSDNTFLGYLVKVTFTQVNEEPENKPENEPESEPEGA